MSPGEAAQHVVDALAGGEPVVEVVVVASEISDVRVGERAVVWADRSEGSLGDGSLDDRMVAAARDALRTRKAGTAPFEVRDARVSVFLEPHYPPDELVIVGAGHIARPLCRVGAMLGYEVTVLDDRPGFATRERFPDAERVIKANFSDPFRDVPLGRGTHLILVTRGHKYDYDALLDVLLRGVDLAYIGMVGSQRRVRAALEQLVKEEGIPRERLESVYAPIGLDIGAETPEEIAISIVGELIRIRRGGTGTSLRDQARVMERWLPARPADSGQERTDAQH
ncbi:MAG: XdhC/CoxI family protein [Gemmatimonadota bacterium]